MKKLFAALLAAVLVLGCCASALGENIKHERVYIVAGPDGDIRSLTDSIRLENKDGLEEIADVSLLTGIENMSGDEAFTRNENALIWQAGGNDIVYQGTSDQIPAIVPTVSLTLEGESVTAAELKNRTGEAVLTVSYRETGALPALAVTLLPLDASGMSNIQAENAMILSEAGQRVLVGYAAPGVDADLGLPDHFTVSFHADHADLNWMMTLISADPIRLAAREIDARLPLDLRNALELAESLLTALKEGKDLPMQPGLQNLKTNLVLGQVNDFNHNVVKLDDSALALRDSAEELKNRAGEAQTSAETLQTSLGDLRTGSDTLNAEASALLSAAFRSARAELSGMGLTVPELTAENYVKALDDAAAGEGQEADAAAKIADLKARLDQTVQLVNSLKAYTEAAAQAAQGAEALNQAVTALKDSAAALHTDAAKLQKNGSAKVKSTVQTAEKQLAALALPYVQRDALHILALYEQTRDQAQKGGYDLRPEGMQAVTVYVIRTDLK